MPLRNYVTYAVSPTQYAVSKKKKSLDAGQMVRENARERIGSPRPTGVRSHRPHSGRARAKLDPTLNGPQPKMLHLTAPRDYVEGAPQRATVDGLHLRVAVPLLPRREKHKASVCFQFTPEVIKTVNLLRQSGGEIAVSEYLKKIKEQTDTMLNHTDMSETLSRANEPKPIIEVGGSIEMALKDAEQKQMHYRAEANRCNAEAERWGQIATRLREVVGLTTAPVTPAKNGNGHANGKTANGKTANGYWKDQIRETMTSPMTRKELVRALAEKMPDRNSATIYQSVLQLGKRGKDIIEVDGKYYLPEWTEPSKAS